MARWTLLTVCLHSRGLPAMLLSGPITNHGNLRVTSEALLHYQGKRLRTLFDDPTKNQQALL